MDIHINILRSDFKINKIWNLLAYRNKPLKGILHCLMKISMLHVASVHEKELMCALLLGRLGFTYETADFAHGSINFYRQDILIEAFTKHIDNPLAKISRTQIKHLYPIAMQREMNLRINQHNTLKCLKNIVQFSRVRFQEFPSGRYIKKKIFD